MYGDGERSGLAFGEVERSGRVEPRKEREDHPVLCIRSINVTSTSIYFEELGASTYY